MHGAPAFLERSLPVHQRGGLVDGSPQFFDASGIGSDLLTGQDAVNWWITDQTDPRHKLNLISDTYIDIGVGYSFFDNFGYYAIVFGTP